MGKAMPKQERFKREHVRAQVVPTQISGMLTIGEESGTQVPFIVWDVSPKGIGLLCTEKPEEGQTVTVTVGQPFVMVLKCQVSWCSQHAGEGYRCGLEVIENPSKLDRLYKAFTKDKEESEEK